MNLKDIVVFFKQLDVKIIILVLSVALFFLSIFINVKSTPLECGPWESKKQKVINEISFWLMIIFGFLPYLILLVILVTG